MQCNIHSISTYHVLAFYFRITFLLIHPVVSIVTHVLHEISRLDFVGNQMALFAMLPFVRVLFGMVPECLLYVMLH